MPVLSEIQVLPPYYVNYYIPRDRCLKPLDDLELYGIPIAIGIPNRLSHGQNSDSLNRAFEVGLDVEYGIPCSANPTSSSLIVHILYTQPATLFYT